MLTFYLHVPKTGGLTFQRWLENVYGPEGLLIWNPQRIWRRPRIAEELAALLAERPSVRAVAGHYPFGVHVAAGHRPYRYVTFLRDPVDRWISGRVHHLTKNTDILLLRRPFSEIFGSTNLFRMLRSAVIHDKNDANLQWRFLSGRPRVAEEAAGHELSDTEILGRYWFVGRQESLAADCRRLADLLGAGDVPWPESRNVAAHGDVRNALTADELAWIEDQNRDDIALCGHVPARAAARPAATPPNRDAIATSILQAALRRMGECFVALHADRLEAQRVMDHYAALAARAAA